MKFKSYSRLKVCNSIWNNHIWVQTYFALTFTIFFNQNLIQEAHILSNPILQLFWVIGIGHFGKKWIFDVITVWFPDLSELELQKKKCLKAHPGHKVPGNKFLIFEFLNKYRHQKNSWFFKIYHSELFCGIRNTFDHFGTNMRNVDFTGIGSGSYGVHFSTMYKHHHATYQTL